MSDAHDTILAMLYSCQFFKNKLNVLKKITKHIIKCSPACSAQGKKLLSTKFQSSAAWSGYRL